MFGTLGASGASPAVLDEAIKILAVVSDPAAARSALDEIKAALADLQTRQVDAVAKESANNAQIADLVATQQAQNQRSADLDEREKALGTRAAQNDVASSALAERESKISAREAAASALEAKLERDAEALAARVASYRAALSA